MQPFSGINEFVASAEEDAAMLEEDAETFYSDDKEAVGTGLREAVLDIKKKARELRQEV